MSKSFQAYSNNEIPSQLNIRWYHTQYTVRPWSNLM